MKFWIPVNKDSRDLLQFAELLGKSLGKETREGVRRKWEPEYAERIQQDLNDFFDLAARLFRSYASIAFLPLLMFCFLSSYGDTGPGFGIIDAGRFLAGFGLVFICGWAFRVFIPVLTVSKLAQEMPPEFRHELAWKAALSIDSLALGLNIGLLTYLASSFTSHGASAVTSAAGCLWLVTPWLLYFGQKDAGPLLKARLAQLVVLLAASFIVAASPIPVWKIQWAARKATAEAIRPFDIREHTSGWETLQWFTPEGQPNVWFCGDARRGFRLFSGPGTTTDTGERLEPVTSGAERQRILDWLADRNARLAAEARHAEMARNADSQMLAAATRKEAEDALVRRYVHRGALGVRVPLACLALSSDGRADESLAREAAKGFSGPRVAPSSEVFTAAFAESDVFASMLAGHAVGASGFRPSDYADEVLLVTASESLSAREPVQGVSMRAGDLTWRVTVHSCADSSARTFGTISARGVGYNDADARQAAVERATRQLPEMAAKISK